MLDRKTFRLQLSDLRVIGMDEPLRTHLDFDAATVGEMLERLAALRTQMLPAPPRN